MAATKILILGAAGSLARVAIDRLLAAMLRSGRSRTAAARGRSRSEETPQSSSRRRNRVRLPRTASCRRRHSGLWRATDSTRRSSPVGCARNQPVVVLSCSRRARSRNTSHSSVTIGFAPTRLLRSKTPRHIVHLRIVCGSGVVECHEEPNVCPRVTSRVY